MASSRDTQLLRDDNGEETTPRVYVRCDVCGAPVLLGDAVVDGDGLLSCDLRPLRPSAEVTALFRPEPSTPASS
jgi:hypothetical protein